MFATSFKTGESISETTNVINVQKLPKSEASQGFQKEKTYFDRATETGIVHHLKIALSSAIREPMASIITFENNKAAALKNINILKNLDFKIENLLKEEKDTCLHPNTEFRDLEVIKPLFDLHENGDKLALILQEGASYPIDESITYSDEMAEEDLFFNIDRGNNKSVIGNEDLIQKILDKEVSRGWMFPIPLISVPDVHGLATTPIGIANKYTLDEHGNLVPKKRMTHDCSRPSKSDLSLNLRMDKDKMEDCNYGLCLLRVMYQIHQLRIEHPKTAILLSKLDFDSAYRRMNVKLLFAMLCTMIFGNLAYILFRLPFGASPASGLFSLLSDFIVDMAQVLAEDPLWIPSTLSSPMAKALLTPIYKEGQFAIALPLLVTITAKHTSFDLFIDDMIICVLDDINLIDRATNAIPLILDAIFRPIFKEKIDRKPILNEAKTNAEGRFEETKTILGWLVDTRNLRVHLPEKKTNQWLHEITEMIVTAKGGGRIQSKKLESLLGKLNHAAIIINEGQFFLNRLRYRLKMMNLNWTQHGHLHDTEIKDLQLWLIMLSHLKEGSTGRSFNHILRTIPQVICISDACEWGLGGYFIIGEWAFGWRFELPEDLRGFFTINFLEFLAAFWTLKTPAELKNDTRFLSVTDSKNAMFWLGKNKHNPILFPLHDILSRECGKLNMKTNCSSEKIHLSGIKNLVSDSFSRDTHIPASLLLQQLRDHATTKGMMPLNFEIYADNEESLCSWLRELKQMMTKEEPTLKARKPSDIATSVNGNSFYLAQGKRATPFSNLSKLETDFNKAITSVASSPITDVTVLAQRAMVQLVPDDLERLSATLHRTSKMKV